MPRLAKENQPISNPTTDTSLTGADGVGQKQKGEEQVLENAVVTVVNGKLVIKWKGGVYSAPQSVFRDDETTDDAAIKQEGAIVFPRGMVA